MSFKIPCGGFKLDEKSFSLDNNDVLSIPKPLTYDYMPEGYPKKDGWSVEWDGNIDGKISAIGVPFYKFSDMVLTYEEFLSAQYVVYVGGEQFSGMVSEAEPKQTQLADAVSNFRCLDNGVQFVVVSKDNAGSDGVIFPTKGLYTNKRAKPFKLIEQTITPMDANFIPKNFNVVFSAGTGVIPTSCNVTYDELRSWIKNDFPVFATYKFKQDDGSVLAVGNIVASRIDTDKLIFYYETGATMASFVYNSDGTFSSMT